MERGTKYEDYKRPSYVTLELDKRNKPNDSFNSLKPVIKQSYLSNCNEKSNEEKVQHIVDDIHLTLSEPVYLVHIV